MIFFLNNYSMYIEHVYTVYICTTGMRSIYIYIYIYNILYIYYIIIPHHMYVHDMYR